MRMTAKAPTEEEARELLDQEDRELRKVLGELVFAVDDDTMESEVLRLCEERGWSLGVAESLTGGFIGARIANVPGASRTFRGSIASYATEVKRDVLGVTAEQVVTEEAAKQMAEGAPARARGRRRDLGHRRRRARRDGGPAGRAPSGTGSRSRATRPRRSPPGCRSTASASASSPRSRCSTSCGCACSRCLDPIAVTGLRRAFVAVVPPPEVLDAVERVVAPVRPVAPPRLNWTHAGQWHLTLQFLGAVDDADELVDALRWGLHGRPPVALVTRWRGAFPSTARASVVWIGLDEGEPELAMLADAVQRATEPLGYEPEHRDFTAHVTVARSQRARPMASLVHSLGDGPIGPVFHVDRGRADGERHALGRCRLPTRSRTSPRRVNSALSRSGTRTTSVTGS